MSIIDKGNVIQCLNIIINWTVKLSAKFRGIIGSIYETFLQVKKVKTDLKFTDVQIDRT